MILEIQIVTEHLNSLLLYSEDCIIINKRIDKMKIRVYYEDTDAGGVMYHTNYINFCERARSEVFFQKNIPMNEDGYFVVKNIEADFKKSAKLGDMLEITTELLDLKKASAKLSQKIYRNDIEIFSLQVSVVYMTRDKIAKIPKNIITLFDTFKSEPTIKNTL